MLVQWMSWRGSRDKGVWFHLKNNTTGESKVLDLLQLEWNHGFTMPLLPLFYRLRFKVNYWSLMPWKSKIFLSIFNLSMVFLLTCHSNVSSHSFIVRIVSREKQNKNGLNGFQRPCVTSWSLLVKLWIKQAEQISKYFLSLNLIEQLPYRTRMMQIEFARAFTYHVTGCSARVIPC